MARITLNMNASATRMMNSASKVRVKVEAGVLMFKPTDRVCGKALPKGEKLVALTKRNAKRTFSLVKFGLRGEIADAVTLGSKLALVEGKRGWVALVSEIGDAQVSVCKG
jgi:hypothetical protein